MAKMIVNVDEKPSRSQLIISIIQQVLASVAATITVPILIGLGGHIASAILGGGIGTLVYILITKRKSPVLLSSNFSFIGALIIAINDYGYTGILIGGLLAGSIYILLSLIVKKTGTAWINKVFPPVVIGPVVMLIGLGLAGSAVSDLLKVENYYYIDASGTIYPYNFLGLLCGLLTFFIIVWCAVQNRFKFATIAPFLFGVLGGYILALIFTLIGNAIHVTYLQIIDFSPIEDNFKNISFNSFIDMPSTIIVDSIKEIHNGGCAVTWLGFLEIFLAFVPISLVGFSEHIADHKNLSMIIGRDLVNDEPGLSRTLLGDGLGSIAGTWLGVCPNTTYGEAIGCIAITKDASWRSIFATSLAFIALSFFTPLISLLRTIPSSVVGGMCLCLFGYIAVSGLKMLKEVDFESNKNIFTLSVILVSGLGGLVLRIPYQFSLFGFDQVYSMSKWVEISANAFSLIIGVLTYAFASIVEKHNKKEDIN